MKTCPFCQSANADTLTYCRSCGKPLSADLPPATDPISVLEKRIASLESEINRISGEVNRANAFSAGALERGKRIPDSGSCMQFVQIIKAYGPLKRKPI